MWSEGEGRIPESPWTLAGTTWWVIMSFTMTGNIKGGTKAGWEGWREVLGGYEKLWKALCLLGFKQLWAPHVMMVRWVQLDLASKAQERYRPGNYPHHRALKSGSLLWTWWKLWTCTLILHIILGESQDPEVYPWTLIRAIMFDNRSCSIGWDNPGREYSR